MIIAFSAESETGSHFCKNRCHYINWCCDHFYFFSVNEFFVMIHISGKLLKQFGELEKLPNFFEDISMRGDELAVAGWADKKLLLFKVVW